jgi:hypothetical protein
VWVHSRGSGWYCGWNCAWSECEGAIGCVQDVDGKAGASRWYLDKGWSRQHWCVVGWVECTVPFRL